KPIRTPPGFSRWYFNFTTTTSDKPIRTPPGFSRWYFNFRATPSAQCAARHHRASAGGTSISEPHQPNAPRGHHQASAGGPISELSPDAGAAKNLKHRLLKPTVSTKRLTC